MRNLWNEKSAWQVLITFVLLLWWFSPILSTEMPGWFEQANKFLNKQDYQKALMAYDTFIKRNPEDHRIPAARWSMAKIFLVKEKNYSRAAALFQEIIKENPGTEWELFAYDPLGKCFEVLQEWQKAVDAYQSMINKLSGYSGGDDTEGRVFELKRRLLNCFQQMKAPNRSIAMYQEFLSENPASPFAADDQFQLAKALLETKQPKAAAENFLLVVEHYPASVQAGKVRSTQADLLQSQLNYDWVAFTSFQAGLELSSKGNFVEALAKFDEVIRIKPNSGLTNAANFQKHIVQFRKTGDPYPLRKEIYAGGEKYPFGFGGEDIGEWKPWIKDIIEAKKQLSAHQDQVESYLGAAWTYFWPKAYHQTIQLLDKAKTIDPDSPDIYRLLGRCFIALQRINEAISAFQKAVDLEPDNAVSYVRLAVAYNVKGDKLKAITLIKKALSMSANLDFAYLMLGNIYYQLGQKKEAVASLEKCSQLNPENQYALNLLNTIKSELANTKKKNNKN